MKMGKKKKGNKRKFTIPIAPLAGMIPWVARAIPQLLDGNLEGAARSLAYDTIGYHYETGKVDPMKLVSNMTPVIIGLLVHKFVGGPPLNLNRMLASAGVPIIRI